MTWWQIILAVLAFIALCLFLAIWAKAAAYRRDAKEHGDDDAQNP